MVEIKQNISKLGLDVGALAIKAAIVTNDGRVETRYRLHKGKPEETIVEIIKEISDSTGSPTKTLGDDKQKIAIAALEDDKQKIAATTVQDDKPCAHKIAITGAGGRKIAEALGLTFVDPAVALVAAAEEYTNVRHVIDIGGASLSIVDLDEKRRFAGYRTNSLCAAGTGSFLDEQAARMKLSSEEMSAEQNIDNPPRIAARCAVFAKSDLIHRQQEGFTINEMWSGLCQGMVTTALTTLFRGRKPAGAVLVAGGVAQNREVVKWLGRAINVELIIPEKPETFSARGVLKAAKPVLEKIVWSSILDLNRSEDFPKRPKLELKLSNYPSFDCKKSYLDDNTEVRIHSQVSGKVVIGIDIGSTSTKAAILDLDGNTVADLYRRTSSEPIAATQKILAAIRRAAGSNSLDIRGVGTTGSGRKMVGAILGADRIVNEITAHASGAVATDPEVETIFEIGGQDSKFIALKNGAPHDSNMNYVCAAGTGSFIEEQANKLGIALTDIGDRVMGISPPYSTDRCTVFMGEDVHALIRSGFTQNEVMGSVLFSVAQNYLNRVVGRRPYSKKKILFMGATARNKGLVAAFENVINLPIVVSPYCHVMGAFGVARIVLSEVALAGEDTKFKGLSLAETKIELIRDVCELCANSCRITRAIVGSETDIENAPSWGYLCGREPDDLGVKVPKGFDAMRKRNRLWAQYINRRETRDTRHETNIGIPRALITHSHLPMWANFFGELGLKVILSKPTNEETLISATDWISGDYCYPVKLAHGHVRELALNPDVNYIFAPYIVQEEPHDDGFKRSVFCPYNIAFPSIIKTSGMLGTVCHSERSEESNEFRGSFAHAQDENRGKILSPVLNFQLDDDRILDELELSIGKELGIKRKALRLAWDAALSAQRDFSKRTEAIGREVLNRLNSTSEEAVVVLGRPYNVCDLGANLNLPQKVADLGLNVLTLEMLPLSNVDVDPLFSNMYWRYGRKILQAAAYIAKHPKLYAVYLTNFGCGPDSFLQTYVEKIMRGKPMLMLELDEHSADAGYITRLEAFKDVINKKMDTGHGTRDMRLKSCESPTLVSGLESRVSGPINNLWLPPMHPYGSPLLAAALRSAGRPARALPSETIETFEMAKSFCRGTECVPAPSTIGAFLKILKESDAPEKECFFMPSAKGPCRFGQYHTLHRMILDEAGYKNTPIEAWSDANGSYCLDARTSLKAYSSLVAADLLFKARCRIRPYAANRDEFDRIMVEELNNMVLAIERSESVANALAKACTHLSAVETLDVKKPLIGIVGEIYVRLNTYTNGHLVETIEDAGGEAWVAPITEWFNYLSFMDKYRAKLERHSIKEKIKAHIKIAYMMKNEKRLIENMMPVICDRLEPTIESTVRAGETFFPKQFDGESIVTVGRAVEFAHQGVSLIINCAPFGCMPGTLTAGIFQKIEGRIGVPIVSLFFDGETDLSHLVRTYMENVK